MDWGITFNGGESPLTVEVDRSYEPTLWSIEGGLQAVMDFINSEDDDPTFFVFPAPTSTLYRGESFKERHKDDLTTRNGETP
jgi:hypothetical protein